MAKKGEFYIGTSGWHYQHWKGAFYPEDINDRDMLSFYAERFSTAEINNSFYNLPEQRTIESWKKNAGKGFVFAVKASRYITHMKKLKDPQKSTKKFFDAAEMLKTKRGPLLFQLPPRWKINARRLQAFTDELPAGERYVFEFRDESWFTEEVYDILSRNNAAFCIYELAGRNSPQIVTASFVYVRLHGPDQEPYKGSYSKRQLNKWASKIDDWTNEGKDVYFYFDNDQNGYAAQNALTLKEILG